MRTIVLSATLVLLFANGFCQNQDSIPKIIFGFNVGINYANTQLKNADPGVQVVNSAGYRMGILADCRLSKHFSVSPKAELSFNNSKIVVPKNADEKEIYQVYPVLMEFALHATYKLFNKKTTPYILLGPSCKVPITGDKKVQYATQRTGFGLDFGLGLDKKLTYFNLAPELRYSLGLTNLSTDKAIGQLYYHSVALVLTFKG